VKRNFTEPGSFPGINFFSQVALGRCWGGAEAGTT